MVEIKGGALESSDKSFRAIFDVTFEARDILFAERMAVHRTEQLTYGQIYDAVLKASEGLYKLIGSSHGYVGLEMESCPEWIVAFWAILRSGNKPYLVNCRYPKKLSAGILKTLNIHYVVGLKPTELDAQYIDYASLPQTDGEGFEGDFEDEIALSTSATTLKETVCFYRGREVSEQILSARAILEECPKMANHYKGHLKQLAFLPFYHIFGLVAVYFWFSFFGCSFVFLPDYSGDSILNTCRKFQVTHIFAVPLLWNTMVKQVFKEAEKNPKTLKQLNSGLELCTKIQNLFPGIGAGVSKWLMRSVTDRLLGRSIQYCISGGSSINLDTLYFFNAIGYSMRTGFGMSEVGISSVDLRNGPSNLNQNSLGRPFSSVEYRINKLGTLEIRGSSISHRKLVNGKEIITSDWLDTGDIVDCSNGYYFYRGRMSDAVIGENGENINPDMIEEHLLLRDALHYCVLGMPTADGSERLTLIVQISEYLSAAMLQGLIDEAYAVNKALPSVTRVQDFFFTYDPIAVTTAVKVGRMALRRAIANDGVKLVPFAELAAKVRQVSSDDFDPNDALSQKVRSLFAKALHEDADKVGDDAHFMNDLGGSSIEYFTLMTLLYDEFGTFTANERETYCYTVREVCRYIRRHM